MGGPLEFHGFAPVPVVPEAGDAADDVVEKNFQVLLHLHGQLPAPLEEDMGRVGDADDERAQQSAAETEPEGGQDDRQVVETLKNVVQVGQVQRSEVVEEADAEDGESQKANAQDG